MYCESDYLNELISENIQANQLLKYVVLVSDFTVSGSNRPAPKAVNFKYIEKSLQENDRRPSYKDFLHVEYYLYTTQD